MIRSGAARAGIGVGGLGASGEVHGALGARAKSGSASESGIARAASPHAAESRWRLLVARVVAHVRSGSFRTVEGTSGRGKWAASCSRARATELPATSSSNVATFASVRCGFSSAATDSDTRPEAISEKRSG